MIIPMQDHSYLTVPSIDTSSYSASVSSDLTEDDDFLDGDDQQPKKKRVRHNLSHLTMEERIERRKMKNRVAAQSARDRKKATMDGMAKKLAILSEERLKLVRENQQLKNSMQRMREENEKLKKLVSVNGMPNEVKSLETVQSMESDEDSASLTSSVASPCASFEPAALINASLPRKQDVQGCHKLNKETRSAVNRRSMKRMESTPAETQLHSLMNLAFWLQAKASQKSCSIGSRRVQKSC